MTLDRLERLFAYAALLFFTSAFFRILPGGGGLAAQVPTAVFYLIAALVLLRNFPDLVQAARANAALMALVAVMMASIGWSLAPDVTLTSAIASLGSTLVALTVAVKLSAEEFHAALISVLGVVAVLSLIAVVIAPGFGIHQASDLITGHHAGSWRGLFGHKNSLGRLMAPMTAILIACAPLRLPTLLRFGLAAVGILLIFGSTSKQGLAVLMFMIIALPMLRRLQSQNALGVSMMLFFGLAFGAAFMLVAEPLARVILESMGRDLTLSGRTTAWAAGIQATFIHRPILGSGFDAGWNEAVLALLDGNPGHAHSGYVTLFQDLGLVGVVLFCVVAGQTVYRYIALRHWMTARTFTFMGAILLYFFLISIVSSEILKQNELPWIIFVVAAVQLSGGVQRVAQPEAPAFAEPEPWGAAPEWSGGGRHAGF